MDKKELYQAALEYHENPQPGKTAIQLTKPTDTQQDLALAYSPGVASPVLEIDKDPNNAYKYTNKGNLVAVISNGSAILGLGNLGALASKPVMEGKGVLFKRFANIDVFDIEVNSPSSESFISTVKNIAPTFGGINLEDIKAPECFNIEETLRDALDIPVFHDDQHGTAIVASAALLNALEIQGKTIENVKIVCLGAGAAAIATSRLLIQLGAKKRNIYMLDRQGVIRIGRGNLPAHKEIFAQRTDKETLTDVMQDADVFIGVSGPNLVNAEQLKSMADKPIIFALSNPDPEVSPQLVKEVRPDAIMATGRSDYPNQVNNVVCFPYLFRGALDTRACCISNEMNIAAVHAIRELAKQPVPQDIIDLYPDVEHLEFGAEYLLPKPMDPRLLEVVAPAVAKAAIDSGAAKKE